jgi:outer membrane protein assembly factor BamD
MPVLLLRRAGSALVLLASLSACSRLTARFQGFRPDQFTTNDSLYRASLREFERGKWGNAVAGFEKLTLELPARDSLLPRSYWYLAQSHAHGEEHLLAAQGFIRLTESFPDDTLADDALLEAGRAYARMWRRPVLDPQYGLLAISTLNSLAALYPSSPLIPEAQREVDRLTEWLATKDYETGLFYLRRKAYDPAIIYFQDIVEKYPQTPKARAARLKLVEAYRAIRYRDDAADVCVELRRAHPADAEVRAVCGAAVADTAAAATP